MADPIVVVGGGLTAAAAVQALRAEGDDGGIVVVGEEGDPPYERPPLSKEFLRGEQEREDLLVHPAEWYAEQGVELRLGARATGLDPSGPVVELSGGERLPARAVLLATGGRARLFPGSEPSERVVTLRTIADTERIRPYLAPGKRVVIVGAGFIGAEVAASARGMGAEVDVVDIFAVPLERVLGREMGEILEGVHRDHGVRLHMGRPVEAVEEKDGAVAVRTEGGEVFEGDLAVVGIGIVPETGLAEEAGAAVDNGVLVDERCRTSIPGVFAAGDVANHLHPLFGRIRVEHFDNALRMGAAAARSILGAEEPYADPHWFWSDQYEHNLQYAGLASAWDQLIVRGSTEDRDFVAFYLKDGVLLAAFAMNRGKEVRRAMKLIAARARPSPEDLRDEETDLRTL